MKKIYFIILYITLLSGFCACKNENITKTLIITGQGDHHWEISSPVLKQILDVTGLFSSQVMTTPAKGKDMSSFAPDFSKYKLVVLDYNGDLWPEKTRTSFIDYVRNGGGVVIYHTSHSAFPDWKEYNEMTGLTKDTGAVEERGLPFSSVHDFEIRTVISDHPVTQGLPKRWMHGKDELMQKLPDRSGNLQILATAYSDTTFAGTGRNEPVLMAVTFGKGRVFHTLLGHVSDGDIEAMQCAGFIVTLQRGAEWAATGTVTLSVPWDFPTAAGVVTRPEFAEMTLDKAFENIINYDIPKSTKYFTFIQSQIRKVAGDEKRLLELEKKMSGILIDRKASKESKKLILRELSWMGSDYCLPSVKLSASDPDLKDDAEFALNRLQTKE